MTFSQSPMIVEGADQHADQIRLFLRAIFGDQGGVVGANACRVRATTPASNQVEITDGQVVVVGKVQPWQGVYTDYNRGVHKATVPGTAASPRKDLLVVRVLDPQYEGNLNPANDNMIYPYLISNVPAGAETLADVGQSGMSATPLARIEIPAQTTTITNDMIKNVSSAPGKAAIANLARPRTESYKDSITSSLTSSEPQSAAVNTWQNWPLAAATTVWVPPWATRLDVTCIMFAIRTEQGDPTGGVRFTINGNAVGDTGSGYNTISGASSTLGTGATVDVTPYQGQTVVIRTQARRTGGTGRIYATGFSSYTFDMCFREAPVF